MADTPCHGALLTVIVSVFSQANGQSEFIDINRSIPLPRGGVAHSGGAELLGFGVIDLTGAAAVDTMLGQGTVGVVRELLDRPVSDRIYVKGQ